MWLIFLAVCIVVALAAMVVLWIGNKIWLAILKDQKEFEDEMKKKEIKEDER